MTELHIITPVSRPSNLPALYHDLISYSAHTRKDVQLNWWVVFDKICGEQADHWKIRLSRNRNESFAINPIISVHEKADKGYTHRNTILDLLEENVETIDIGQQWVYNLDDDNILHPYFLPLLLKKQPDDVDVLVVNQEQLNGYTRFIASWEGINTGKVDLAMLIFKIKALKGNRFNEAGTRPSEQFVQAICNANKTQTQIINEKCSYYNYLR
jgi:hypothetical protein